MIVPARMYGKLLSIFDISIFAIISELANLTVGFADLPISMAIVWMIFCVLEVMAMYELLSIPGQAQRYRSEMQEYTETPDRAGRTVTFELVILMVGATL